MIVGKSFGAFVTHETKTYVVVVVMLAVGAVVVVYNSLTGIDHIVH